jgi:hypothetical protein
MRIALGARKHRILGITISLQKCLLFRHMWVGFADVFGDPVNGSHCEIAGDLLANANRRDFFSLDTILGIPFGGSLILRSSLVSSA